MDNGNEMRDFLVSRRARITPEQPGLPVYGGNRRVTGLRREEVALLAGVSIDYYTRLERGRAHGASESGLDRPSGRRIPHSLTMTRLTCAMPGCTSWAPEGGFSRYPERAALPVRRGWWLPEREPVRHVSRGAFQ